MYLLVEILQLEHEISNLAEAPNKAVLLEIFSKFTDKHKKQSSGGALSKNTLKKFAKFTKNIFPRVSFLIKLHAENLKLSEAATGDVP